MKCIDSPRENLSPYAPKMYTLTIHPDKIRDVIGSGGKTIQKIIAETGVKIDIEDDGRVFIAAVDDDAAQKAIAMVNGIANDPEIGQEFDATITKIMTFGAFAEFLPGKEGLIHISKLAKERINKVEDVVSVGDKVRVRIAEIDRMGRINLAKVLD